MPIGVTVQRVGARHRQVIVPVRIERAFTTLPPECTADVAALPLAGDMSWGARYVWRPDIDDRGWLNPGKVARGPAIGLPRDVHVAVKVRRVSVPADLPLFATVEAAASPTFTLCSAADVTQTGSSQAVGADGLVVIKGILAGETHALEVRWGRSDGPVIARAHVVVHAPLPLALATHRCTLVGVDIANVGADQGLPADFSPRRALSIAQAKWIPAGIVLSVQAGADLTIQGRDEGHAEAPVTVKRHHAVLEPKDMAHFVNRAPDQRTGVFFVPWGSALGFAVRRKVDGTSTPHPGNRPGVFVAVHGQSKPGQHAPRASMRDPGLSAGEVQYTIGNDLAHEIGHLLDLDHNGLPRWGRQSNGPNATYNRRALLYHGGTLQAAGEDPGWSVKAPQPRFSDVGHGALLRGTLLSLKPHAFEPQATDVSVARTALGTAGHCVAAAPVFDSPQAQDRYKLVVEIQKLLNLLRYHPDRAAAFLAVPVTGVWDVATKNAIKVALTKQDQDVVDPTTPLKSGVELKITRYLDLSLELVAAADGRPAVVGLGLGSI